MTSGIYQLNFNNRAFYIGQSVDVEARWKQHFDKFRKGTAAKKMQDAYNMYGLPDVSLLLVCHKDYLDMMENYFISVNQQYNGCLNTSAPALDPKVDYQWLLSNIGIIQHSQFELITSAVDAVSQKNEAREELEDIQSKFNNQYLETKAKIEVGRGRDQNEEYANLYPAMVAKAKQVEEAIIKLQNRGLLQRIFNYD